MMLQIEYSQDAQDDIVRLTMYLLETAPEVAMSLFEVIEDGVMLLSRHPLAGRSVSESGLRELVISRGKSGYLALYHYDELMSSVMIVAIKHQREDGFN